MLSELFTHILYPSFFYPPPSWYCLSLFRYKLLEGGDCPVYICVFSIWFNAWRLVGLVNALSFFDPVNVRNLEKMNELMKSEESRIHRIMTIRSKNIMENNTKRLQNSG